MIELKARHSLPPQPNLLSRIPALSSRELKTPHIPFPTLMDTTIVELQKDMCVMPPQKKVPKPFRLGNPIVVLATNNGIREEDFRKKIPHAKLRRIPFDEKPTADTLQAAHSKANSAAKYENTHRSWKHPLWKFQEIRKRGLWKASITVGLDSVNVIPQIQEDKVIFTQLGKPQREAPGKELELIKNRFQALSEMALQNDWPAIPIIAEMSQYLHNTSRRGKNGRYDSYHTQRIVIMLDPNVLAYIATPKGFLEYIQISFDSYPLITQTAAGIKREVLDKMGAIISVSDNAEELQSMKFDISKQKESAELADRIARGKLDPALMNEYIDKL